MTIPNFITIGRLFLVPLTVWLIVSGEPVAAFWVFVIAGISDGVDGFIARQFNQRSDLGAYLDPLADKALLVSVYVTLGTQDYLPHWLVILVVFRDLLIVGGAILFWLVTGSLKMRPLFISKLNTVAQIGLAGVVLAELGLGLTYEPLSWILVDIVGATTLLSGGAYVAIWGWRIARMGDGA